MTLLGICTRAPTLLSTCTRALTFENVLYRKDSVMAFAIGGVGMVGKGGKAGKGGKTGRQLSPPRPESRRCFFLYGDGRCF